MVKQYFRLFFRDLLRHKSHFLLNLAGLTAGMICLLFALLYSFYENGYDTYHLNKDRIARVVTTVTSGGNVTPVAYSNGFLTRQMPARFPEITGMVRFLKFQGRAAVKVGDTEESRVRNGENKMGLENIYYTDPGVFNVFSYRVLQGDPRSCLKAPGSIVLTRKIAGKLFGHSPSIGKAVSLNGKLLQVTAVIEDLPGNSDLPIDVLISIKTLLTDESDGWLYTYILFNNAAAMDGFLPKLEEYARTVVKPQMGADATIDIHYSLQPLCSIHFSQSLQYDTPKGNRSYVRIFLAMGILVLIIACTNSINLTVVKSFSRSLEVSIQKIYGAGRMQLIARQMMEPVLTGLIAICLSFLVVQLLLPVFAVTVNRNLGPDVLWNGKIVAAMALALAGISAGGAVYTGFYLRHIRLADALRSKSRKTHGLRMVPRWMLGFQFFISMGMIVGALSVYRQVHYFKETPLGFDPHDILVVDLPQEGEPASGDKYLRRLLDSDPNVLMTSFCGATALPGSDMDVDVMEYRENGIRVRKTVNHIDVDANYFRLLGIPVIRGAGFDDPRDSTARNHTLVTDAFVRKAGWTQPIGESFVLGGQKTTVTGVVPDFHFSSLHAATAPLVIFQGADEPAYLLIKMERLKTVQVVKDLSAAWKKTFPDLPFYYRFLDQHLLEQYRDEDNLLSLLLTLALLIIVISCIGLIAYVSFILRITQAELAIRRIIGASFGDIYRLFIGQYAGLLILALLTAAPVAWYLLNKWLDQFAYHIYPRGSDFLVAPGVMVVIVAIVVGFYTQQCVRSNAARIIREA